MLSRAGKWIRPLALVALLALPCCLLSATQSDDKKSTTDKKDRDKTDRKESDSPDVLAVPQKELNDQFIEIVKLWVEVYADVLKDRPGSKRSARDNAYAALNLVTFGVMAPSAVIIPVGCTAIGAGLGAYVGIHAAGVGAVLGGGIGAAIGFGVGVELDVPVIVTAMTILVAGVMIIEEKYPATTSSAAGRGDHFVAFYQGGPAGRERYAGPHESLTVHLLDLMTNEKVTNFGRQWDNLPGLNARQRKVLRHVNFLKPTFEKIAYIKQNKRISPRSLPAKPLATMLGDVKKFLHADKPAIERAWLTALGVTSLGAKVGQGNLYLNTPKELKAAGAVQPVTMKLPALDVKVPPENNGSRTRPYIKVAVKFGDFDLQPGKAEILKGKGADQGKIRLEYLVRKSARLCEGSFKYRWDGAPKIGTSQEEKSIPDMGAVRAKLGSDLKDFLYLRATPKGLVFDRFEAPAVKLDLGMPSLPRGFAPLAPQFKMVSNPLRDQIQSEFKKVVGSFAGVDKLSSYGKKSLLKQLRSDRGLVKQVDALSIRAGQLGAQVTEQVYKVPAEYPKEVKKVLARLNSRETKDKFAQVKKLRPSGSSR
jgi:hypothetical protein